MQALFHQALDLPEFEREAFLEACYEEDDPPLIDDVRALLAEDARGASLLDQNLADLAGEVLDGSVPGLRSVGPYRVRAVLGRGGMGVVYLAERDDLGSRVAIKVLRDASLSPARRERFVREQQVLAHLIHPAIARFYDAGTLPDGTPYFVMEHVEGVPLTDYCRGRGCPVPERLRLFRAVCDAVQYAHRQAIIHRDLKPSNVLVTPDGEVRLLDFGIAKQLEDVDASVRQTQTELRLMTPAYAAPEQLRGEPVGVYTDVYALGVVLYELLTGRLPFDLRGCTPGQAEGLLLAQDPERPSVWARQGVDGDVRAPRLSAPGRRAWADLDVLCLTAMHKDPQRRYPTVEALMRDLDHYLNGEPLEARADTLGYRMGKFVRRHRRAVAATALVIAVIVGVVVFYTVRLTAARDAALVEAARTQRIQRFLLNLFEGGDASVGPADSLRVVTLIDRGVQEARVLDGEPDIQVELYQTLGRIYQQLGRLEAADSLLQAALAHRRAHFGPDHPEVALSLVALGLLRADQAVLEEAEAFVREGLDKSRHLLPGHPAVVTALTALGQVKTARGEYDEAIRLLEEAVRLHAARAPSSIELSESLTELANAHFYAGHYAASDSLNRLVLAMDQQLYGRRHPLVASSLVNLGATRFQLGYYAEAEQFYRQALEIKLAYYGPDHFETAANMMMLGQALTYQERYDEALALLQPALDVRERVYGPEHPLVASALNELGTVALKQGDLAAAESYYNRMRSIYDHVYGEKHYLMGIALSNLASVHLEDRRYESGARLLTQVVALFTEALSADHLNTSIAQIKLGRALIYQRRYGEAKEHLLAGYENLVRQASPSVSWLQAARSDLATAYEALGEPQEAAWYRAEHERAQH